MGQRHQIFAVAKVKSTAGSQPSYRCVAAFHHQWLYGMQALSSCKRILRALRVEDNSRAILAELASPFDDGNRDEKIPCPFVSTLFSVMLGCDFEKSYFSESVYVQDATFKSTEGDNNDGITVIDITKPNHPRYCFISICGLEGTGYSGADGVPMSAEEYVRAYYPIPTQEKLSTDQNLLGTETLVKELVQEFHNETLLELSIVAQAFPDEIYGYSEAEVCSTPLPDRNIPSLANIALKKGIDHAILTGDGSDLLSIHWTQDLAKIVGDTLRGCEMTDVSVQLLKKTLGQPALLRNLTLDLTTYWLTASQITEVVASVPDVATLDLSNNPHVNMETIRSICSSCPNISRLLLIGCNGISGGEIDKLYEERVLAHCGTVYHTDLLLRSMKEELITLGGLRKGSLYCKQDVPSEFALVVRRGIHPSFRGEKHQFWGCSFPVLHSGVIVQGMLDYFNFWKADDPDIYTGIFLTHASNGVKACFATVPRPLDVKPNDRVVTTLPSDLNPDVRPGSWILALDSGGWFIRDTNDMAPFTYAFLKIAENWVPPSVHSDGELPDSVIQSYDLNGFLENAQIGKSNVDIRSVEKLKEYLGRAGQLNSEQGRAFFDSFRKLTVKLGR